MAPNVRPSGETLYPIASSDDGRWVVNKNPTAPVTWQLSDGVVAEVRLTNGQGYQPLLIQATGAGRFFTNFNTIKLAPFQTADVTWDGTDWQVAMGQGGHSTDLGNVVNLVGYSNVTNDLGFVITGTAVQGEVVGFDYHFTLNGTPTVVSPRHTMAAGDTPQNAWQDVLNQCAASSALRSFLGDEIYNFTFPPGFSPFQSGPSTWVIGWEQLYPGAQTASVVPVSSAHATVSTFGGGTGIVGGCILALGSGSDAPPAAGNTIAQIYVLGDRVSQKMDVRDINPRYALISYEIIDPNQGTARVYFETADHVFEGPVEVKPGNVGDPPGPYSVLSITGAAGSPATDAQISSFGEGVFPRLLLRNARGTAQAPTAVKAGDYLGLISMQPFNGSGRIIPGALAFRAVEDFDQGHNGTCAELYVTPSGQPATQIRGAFVLWDNGSAVITAAGTEPTIKPTAGRMSAAGFDVGSTPGVNGTITTSSGPYQFMNGILTSVPT